MTAPVVIQNPGAAQTLTQGFQQGFTPILQALQFRRQLEQSRAQLAIEQQRANTMEGFRSAEAQKYQQDVADKQQQLDAATRANGIFTHLAQTGAFGDPIAHQQDPTKGLPDQNAITNALAGENGLVQSAFQGHMQAYAGNLQAMAKAQSDQAAATAADRNNRTQQALGLIQQKYQGKDLTDPKTQGAYISDLATTDIGEAQKAATALAKQEGDYTFIVSPANGQVYRANKRSGAIEPTGQNVGVKGALGSLTPEESRVAAGQLVDAADRYLALARTDPSAIRPSGLAATLQGAAGKSVMGVPVGGAAQVGAQMAMTPNQQVAKQLQSQIITAFLSLQPKSRQGQTIAQQTIGGYFAPAGTSPEAIGSALQSLLTLRNSIAKIRDGKPFDARTLPGFTDFAKAAAQEAGPQATPSDNPGDYLH